MGHVADIYQQIAENTDADPKLQAYALCDLGTVKQRSRYVRQPGGLERLLQIVERSSKLLPLSDPKHTVNFFSLSGAYWRLGELDKSLQEAEKAVAFYSQANDIFGMARGFFASLEVYAVEGVTLFSCKKRTLTNYRL